MYVVFIFTFLLSSVSLAEGSKPSLWSYQVIDRGLFNLGVAWSIKENCGHIRESRLPAINALLKLNNFARSKGYSRSEIKNFIESPVEETKLRERVRVYFIDRNLNPDQPNGLCQFGEENIAQRTAVGRFIWSTRN